jgi:hypothetical protein
VVPTVSAGKASVTGLKDISCILEGDVDIGIERSEQLQRIKHEVTAMKRQSKVKGVRRHRTEHAPFE